MSRSVSCWLAPALALALTGCPHERTPTSHPVVGAALLRCTVQTQSRLYFGFDAPGGPVTDAAWRDFVQTEITPRLPAGFTLLSATGQWRGADGISRHEDSRVLEAIGDDDAAQRHVLAEIVARYKVRFNQESVLVTLSPTRACW